MSFTYTTQKAVFAGNQISCDFCSHSSDLSFPKMASIVKPLTCVHQWPSPPMEFGLGVVGRCWVGFYDFLFVCLGVLFGWFGFVWGFVCLFYLEWKYLGESDRIWEFLDLYWLKTAANLCLGFLVRTETRLLNGNAIWKTLLKEPWSFWQWRSPRVIS